MKTFNWEDEAITFLTNLFAELDENELAIRPHWQIDHLCYRVDSEEAYLYYKNYFLSNGDLLVESLVSGRLISTFKLLKPLKFKSWTIDVIELPAPKIGAKYQNGFEHIEIVCDLSFEDIKRWLRKQNLELKGLAKNFNPELELILKMGSIKFHHQSLESVVNLEKSKAFAALERGHILNELKEYQPIVVGTFPLKIDMPASDVDIVIYSSSLKELIKKKPEFKQGEGFAVWSFRFEEIDFEIFAQELSPVMQNGFRHFNIEERLLKLGGHSFREKILGLRNKGFKTEDSFCRALNIKTDNPFQELLKYYEYSEEKLKELLDASN